MPNDNILKHHVADDFLTVCDEIMDFSRNNAHDAKIKNLLERYDILAVWDKYADRVDYTYSNALFNAFSCIDHFCVQNSVMCDVIDTFVHDCSLNHSGHSPRVMDVTVNTTRITMTKNVQP